MSSDLTFFKRSTTIALAVVLMGCNASTLPATNTPEELANTADQASPGEPIPLSYAEEVSSGVSEFGIASLAAPINLGGIKLLSTMAQPAQEVLISGIPTGMGKIRVAILSTSGDFLAWGLIRLVDNSSVALVAPVLPEGVAPDGRLLLVVSVRGTRSATLPLQLTALPSTTTDAGKAYLDELTDIISMPTPGATESELAPLLHKLVDDPTNSNPNSLRAMLEGTAPVLEGQTLDPRMLNGLLKSTGAVESMHDLKRAYQQEMASFQSTESIAISSSKYAVQGLIPLTEKQLIARLQDRATLQRLLRGASVNANNSIAKAVASLSVYSSMVQNSDYWGLFWKLFELVDSLHLVYDVAVMPGRLTSLDLSLSQTSFSPACGGSGTWRASVRAVSSGLDVSSSSLINTNNLSAGLVFGTLNGLRKVAEIFNNNSLDFLGDVSLTNDGRLTVTPRQYQADVTNWCYGSFNNSAAVRSLSGNKYEILSSSGAVDLTVATALPDVNNIYARRTIQLSAPAATHPIQFSINMNWGHLLGAMIYGPSGLVFSAGLGMGPYDTTGSHTIYVGPGNYTLYQGTFNIITGFDVYSVKKFSFPCQ